MNKIMLIFIVSIFSLPGFAHPGLVDETGGHVDQHTGEYHYHGEESLDTPYVEHVHDHESYQGIALSLLLIILFALLILYTKRKINH